MDGVDSAGKLERRYDTWLLLLPLSAQGVDSSHCWRELVIHGSAKELHNCTALLLNLRVLLVGIDHEL